jgi:hypothetical protein
MTSAPGPVSSPLPQEGEKEVIENLREIKDIIKEAQDIIKVRRSLLTGKRRAPSHSQPT